LWHSAYEVAVGYTTFRDHTGLRDPELISVPVAATPLPRYPDAVQDRARLWSRVTPEALWHPLFWLPGSVWARQVRDGMVEPDEIWAIRICLQLDAADLWHPEHGWLDILYTAGIDTDSPDDMARVLNWQAGSPDPALDQMDLSGLFDGLDQRQYLDAATELVLPLQHANWAVTADEIISYIDEAEAGHAVLPRATTIVELGAAALTDVRPDGLLPGSDFWPAIEDTIADCQEDPDQILSGPFEEIREWAGAVRVQYGTAIQELGVLDDAGR
jgi:hypothetical protein